MESLRCEHDEDVTVVRNPQRILRDGRRTAGTSSATNTVGNSPIAPKSLETALEEVATYVSRADGKGMFDGVADGPVSEERSAPRIRPTHSRSYARPDDTVRYQASSIQVVVDDTDVQHFDEAGRAAESRANSKVLAEIATVVSRSDAEAFSNSSFQSAVEGAAHKCLAETTVTNRVATRTIDIPALTVPVDKCIKSEVVKCSVENA